MCRFIPGGYYSLFPNALVRCVATLFRLWTAFVELVACAFEGVRFL